MSSSITAQVDIGTETPNATYILDVESTTKGFLSPRLCIIQQDNVLSPAEGLVIYNTSTHFYSFIIKTVWVNTCNTKAPVTINIARLANISSFGIGDTSFPEYNAQLKNPVNYFPTGTCVDMNGFSFTRLSSAASETAVELKANYDIICVDLIDLTVVNPLKLKDYVDLGGRRSTNFSDKILHDIKFCF